MCQTNSLPSEQIAYISGLCVKKSFVSLNPTVFITDVNPKMEFSTVKINIGNRMCTVLVTLLGMHAC